MPLAPTGGTPAAPPWKLHRAVRHLRLGGIIAYPTEAVYGLGCDPFNQRAVERLLTLKGRPKDKGLILVAATPEQVLPLIEIPDPALWERMRRVWPGPVTWVAPARKWIPKWLRGAHTTLAVRVTAHPLAAALSRAFRGPIVSTSANKSGMPALKSPLRVRKVFPSSDVLVVHGATGGQASPTAIYEASSGRRLR